MHHSGADNQPNPIFNSATNTVDAGNWSVTDFLGDPVQCRVGCLLRQADDGYGNFQNMIPFIVARRHHLGHRVPDSDTTWEAYNPWGGYNLYQGPSGSNSTAPMPSATIARSP